MSGFTYGATAPAGVHGLASRAPDSNGGCNHAFDVAFTGSDAVSGIGSCTESYSVLGGYDVTAVATDVAGNAGPASATVALTVLSP